MGQDRTSLSVTHSLKDELDAEKTHGGESYESVLWRLLETDSKPADVDTDEIAEDVADHLNGLEWHVNTAQVSGEVVDQLTDELDTGSDVQLDTADVIGRIEDLETTLPRKVASELSR